MKLSTTAQSPAKVTPGLAQKIQPLIVAAVATSGLSRQDIQAALLKRLEGIPSRIGVATAARLLRNPDELVTEYKANKQQGVDESNTNFKKSLTAMVSRLTRGNSAQVLDFIDKNLHANRSFKELSAVTSLMLENGCRPLTMVKLPNTLPTDHPAVARIASGYVLLKDGESLAVSKAGVVYGPVSSDALPVLLQQHGHDANNWLNDSQVDDTAACGRVHSTPIPPQRVLPGIELV